MGWACALFHLDQFLHLDQLAPAVACCIAGHGLDRVAADADFAAVPVVGQGTIAGCHQCIVDVQADIGQCRVVAGSWSRYLRRTTQSAKVESTIHRNRKTSLDGSKQPGQTETGNEITGTHDSDSVAMGRPQDSCIA